MEIFRDLIKPETVALSRPEADKQMRQAVARFEAVKRGAFRRTPREIAAEAIQRRGRVILGRYAF